MSRLERKFTAAEEASVDCAELLGALDAQMTVSGIERQEAIARYLAAGDGWREALLLLGGAFAGRADAARLTSDKGA